MVCSSVLSAWTSTSWSSESRAASTACAPRGASRSAATVVGASAARMERRKRALRCTRASPADPRSARSSTPLSSTKRRVPSGCPRREAESAVSKLGTRFWSVASRIARRKVLMRPALSAAAWHFGLFCKHVLNTAAAAGPRPSSWLSRRPATASSPPMLSRSLALSMDSARYSISSSASTRASASAASSRASLSLLRMVARSPSPRIVSRNSRYSLGSYSPRSTRSRRD
mmetsp:Transcript_16216/g.43686  ORF Transcript_16216/g.43686 Transcript_16216/m.43686 type:complete len:230 (-) Transcript_16216:315-1004(-)